MDRLNAIRLLQALVAAGANFKTPMAVDARRSNLRRSATAAVVHRDPGIDAEEVARAVFAILAARLPEAELEGAEAATPKSLHNLWPS